MNPRFFGDILGKFSFCDTYFSEQVATSQTIFQGFFTISPMSSLTNFRYGVFVNIGCAKDARLNVSRQMAKARWKGLYGRWKKNISAKNIALMTGTVVTILVDPPLKWNPTASIRGLSVAQMPKNHTIPASRILPSPFPPGPKSWRATRNSLKLQEFRKGDEIYGMTIETVVPWTSSKNPGPWCLYVTKRIHRWWCVNQLTVDQCSKKTVLQWLFSLWRLICIHWLSIGMYVWYRYIIPDLCIRIATSPWIQDPVIGHQDFTFHVMISMMGIGWGWSCSVVICCDPRMSRKIRFHAAWKIQSFSWKKNKLHHPEGRNEGLGAVKPWVWVDGETAESSGVLSKCERASTPQKEVEAWISGCELSFNQKFWTSVSDCHLCFFVGLPYRIQNATFIVTVPLPPLLVPKLGKLQLLGDHHWKVGGNRAARFFFPPKMRGSNVFNIICASSHCFPMVRINSSTS